MYALGAYVTAILAVRGVTSEIVPLLLIGGAAAMAAGALVAFPALRMGGWSLAMASFYLVITISNVVSLKPDWTGGLNGLPGIPQPTFFGKVLDSHGIYYVTMIAGVVWFACYRNLVTSRYGVIFRILRESPVQASSLGFSPRHLKRLAYTLGALPAGMAGCIFAFLSAYLSPSTFNLTLAIAVVAASVLGGVESVYGVIVGAAILQLGPERSVSFQQYAPIAYGMFLVVAAVVFRRGLGGIGKSAALRLSRLLVPSVTETAAAPGSLALLTEPEDAPTHKAQLAPRETRTLVAEGVSKSFGGVHALRDVSLRAEPGAITALIGSNGSGKTTLLNVICGYFRPDAGSVMLGDERLIGKPPHVVANHGVAGTFQTPSIPRGVTVLDVVASGRFRQDRCGVVASMLRLPRHWAAVRADRDEARAYLELVELEHLAHEEAGRLSLGTRRLVEVARALCAKPSLLLLDEPASGLSENEVEKLGAVIRAASGSGVTVLLIEHNFQFVTGVSDFVYVLHGGEQIAAGPPETIAEDARVIESYLGGASMVPVEVS